MMLCAPLLLLLRSLRSQLWAPAVQCCELGRMDMMQRYAWPTCPAPGVLGHSQSHLALLGFVSTAPPFSC